MCMNLWTACCLILHVFETYSNAVTLHMSPCSFLCLWGLSLWKGFALVCWLSPLDRMSFNICPRVHWPSILSVAVLSFVQVFAIPSHAVMKILIHVSWYTCPKITNVPNVRVYLQRKYVMPDYSLNRFPLLLAVCLFPFFCIVSSFV